MQGSVVAAYAPNILHSWPSTASASAVGLDGGGTSHTTPQVAAFRDRLIAEGVIYAPRYG